MIEYLRQFFLLPRVYQKRYRLFPAQRSFSSGKAVMRMTTEMFVNILALVFTVLSTGVSIGLYIANKKNDR